MSADPDCGCPRTPRRYLHYHSRWKAHADSLALEEATGQKLQAKIAALEARGSAASDLADFAWLGAAQGQLFRARRCLSNSYVFAFYMFGTSMFDEISPEQNKLNQNLFEDNQADLEATVEQLSALVEADADAIRDETRLLAVNLTALADTRCANLHQARMRIPIPIRI